jgi:uncharacterized membrane protein
MNKLFLVFYILLCVPFMVWAEPKIIVDPPSVQFLDVMKGDKQSIQIEIKNTGDDMLDIIRIRPSCGCLTIDLPKKWIPPAGSIKATLTFDSTTKQAGAHQLKLHIRSSDPDNQLVVVPVLAFVKDVVAGLAISPQQIDFGQVTAGSSPSSVIEVVNEGTKPYKIIEIIAQAGIDISHTFENVTILPGEKIEVPVTIHSWVKTRRFHSAVIIRTTDPAVGAFHCKIKARIK